jgi:ATP-dependent Lon protease
LLDRMEVLPLQGYTEIEKLQIAKRHLLPKQLRDHGVQADQLRLETETILSVIRSYTRESGVRLLEQQLAKICRKTAKQIVLQQAKSPEHVIEPLHVDAKKLTEFLGPAKYRQSKIEAHDLIGAVTGLAWTEVGGDTMMIEVTVVPGKGKLTLTGKLGDVMKESAQAAFSYIRSKADQFGIPADFHETNDIHIHVPEGAIPKDGPSAGITMATAIISALTKQPVSREVAMTGEITLRGRVLPIGGLKEKSLAAHRAGIKKVLVPIENEKDLADVPESVREEMAFHLVAHMDEVLEHALVKQVWIQ